MNDDPRDCPEPFTTDKAIVSSSAQLRWLIIAGVLLLDAMGLVLTRIAVSLRQSATGGGVILFLLVLTIFYTRWRPRDRLADLTHTAAQLMALFAAVGDAGGALHRGAAETSICLLAWRRCERVHVDLDPERGRTLFRRRHRRRFGGRLRHLGSGMDRKAPQRTCPKRRPFRSRVIGTCGSLRQGVSQPLKLS